MNRHLAFVAVPALIAGAVSGCARPGIVGTWEGSVPVPATGKPSSVSTRFEFRPDGTMTQTANSKYGTFGVAGTYKFAGDTLSMTVTEMRMNGSPVPPAAMKQMPKDSLNIEGKVKLEGDTLTLMEGPRTITMKRLN